MFDLICRRTFRARCSLERQVIVRLDPEAKSICGNAQQEGILPACLPWSEKNSEAVVRQVAEHPCR